MLARKNEAKAAKRNSRFGKPLGWAYLIGAAALLGAGIGLYIVHLFHASSFLRLQWVSSSKDALSEVISAKFM
jgi:zinc transporter ZupT